MNAEERARLRAEGRRRAAAELPDITPECARHIAELLREPINQYVAKQRARCARDGARRMPPDGKDAVRPPEKAGPPASAVTTAADAPESSARLAAMAFGDAAKPRGD